VSNAAFKEDPTDTTLRPFVVVMKGPSGVCFAPDAGSRFFLPVEGRQAEVRVRSPENLLAETHALQQAFGVTAFRFVDDLSHPTCFSVAPHSYTRVKGEGFWSRYKCGAVFWNLS